LSSFFIKRDEKISQKAGLFAQNEPSLLKFFQECDIICIVRINYENLECMQMDKTEIVNTLIQSAECNGLIPTIEAVFGKTVTVSVAFGHRTLDSDVEEIDFSVRASNCLKRAGMSKILDIVEAIEEDRLLRVRNLGKTSYNEIQTKLLVLAYGRFSAQEKQQFFADMLERNPVTA
jgi:DNA-directed RNA polymerase alpha subunit